MVLRAGLSDACVWCFREGAKKTRKLSVQELFSLFGMSR
jgi:hypothetical protein